jgi:hypothetical protein
LQFGSQRDQAFLSRLELGSIVRSRSLWDFMRREGMKRAAPSLRMDTAGIVWRSAR